MPKLTGVFETLKDIDRVPIFDIKQWLRAKEQDFYLENYIGNRLLYPQTVAVSEWDMEIDLAIIREYIKRHTESFYDQEANRLIIPEDFIARFSPVNNLISAMLDVLTVHETTTIIALKQVADVVVAGSLITIPFTLKEDFIDISIDDQQMRFKVGKVQLLPIQDSQVKVVMEKDSDALFVPGGQIGLLLDLRMKGDRK